jgi:hypothetical protein
MDNTLDIEAKFAIAVERLALSLQASRTLFLCD